MSDIFPEPGEAATPLTPGEIRDLIPAHIAYRRDLLIHPFPNGNGRHARLMADLLAMQLGGERFSWGRESLRGPGAARACYIEALHAADNHDIGPLLAFARA